MPARRSYIGIAGGIMNYGGYMQPKSFTLSQISGAGEIMYRYDVTTNFHVRATGLVGWLQRSNQYVEGQTPDRSGYFQTGIAELNILPEYDFLNITPDKQLRYQYKWTPYIYAGGGAFRMFHYKGQKVNAENVVVNTGIAHKWGADLRGGIGIKYVAAPGIQLFFEGEQRVLNRPIDFYQYSNSHYFSIMIGGIFSLQKIGSKNNW
ncbi:hypothetical protein A9P82_07025 [Arachidicoccus ginsenosidimutans]|nr:hypothetical protein A9P82_07025 [Arachidicoccus sp. BS20]